MNATVFHQSNFLPPYSETKAKERRSRTHYNDRQQAYPQETLEYSCIRQEVSLKNVLVVMIESKFQAIQAT